MTPEQIFHIGVVICGVAVVGALIAAILLRCFKARLNRQLDSEYGKRRH